MNWVIVSAAVLHGFDIAFYIASIFWEESRFPPKPKHVAAVGSVEFHVKEAEGLIVHGRFVKLEKRGFVVHGRQLLDQALDFLRGPRPIDDEISDVLANG